MSLRPIATACVLAGLALLLFLVAWHLLTKYRVNIYVRFLNVPSPEQVLELSIANVTRARNHIDDVEWSAVTATITIWSQGASVPTRWITSTSYTSKRCFASAYLPWRR